MNARRWRQFALLTVGVTYLANGCTQWIPWIFQGKSLFWPLGQYLGAF